MQILTYVDIKLIFKNTYTKKSFPVYVWLSFHFIQIARQKKKNASGRVSPNQQELECGQVLAESVQPFIHPRTMC